MMKRWIVVIATIVIAIVAMWMFPTIIPSEPQEEQTYWSVTVRLENIRVWENFVPPSVSGQVNWDIQVQTPISDLGYAQFHVEISGANEYIGPRQTTLGSTSGAGSYSGGIIFASWYQGSHVLMVIDFAGNAVASTTFTL